MSLYFIDSAGMAIKETGGGLRAGLYDHYGTTSDSYINAAVASRRGGYCHYLNNTNNSGWIRKHLPAGAQFVVGMAFKKITTMPGSYQPLFQFEDTESYNKQVEIKIGADGSIQATANGSVLGASAAGVILVNTYCFIEVKVVLHGSTGSVVVRVDGTTVLNLTGQNTNPAGTGQADHLWISGLPGVAGGIYFHDVYILDGVGPSFVDFLGDVKIESCVPTVDGNYKQFTRSSGVNGYALLDDRGVGVLTDYVESSTVGHRDTYKVGLPTIAQTILAVCAKAVVANTDAGSRSVALTCRSNGTDHDGPTEVLTAGNRKTLSKIWVNDPDGEDAWTLSNLGPSAGNSVAEFGLTVVA